MSATPGASRALAELVERLGEHRLHRRGAESDDARSRLELGEEEHLVDQLGDLVDLAARLLDERGHVLAGKRRRLEQGEKARERCPELVRDGRREPGTQLLVRSEVALAREVDEPLAPSFHLVRDDERDHAALAAQEIGRKGLTLPQPVDRLARATARVEHAIGVVEHDDRLPALLDEHPPPGRVGVRHAQRSNRTLANRLLVAHGVRTHMSVNACVLEKGRTHEAQGIRSGRVAVLALTTATLAAAAVVTGTPGDDVLRGTADADRISAFAGNDLVYARAGGDDIRAGAGNDGVRAADGGDVAYGGRGNDLIAGGDGADRLKGGSDSDRVNGGDGPDRASGNKGADDVSGGEGDDSLFGGWGADRVYGGSGNDELHALAADGDVDLLQCGPGRDKAWVLRAERPRTQIVGCEVIYLVDVVSPDQEEGENADADTEADE